MSNIKLRPRFKTVTGRAKSARLVFATFFMALAMLLSLFSPAIASAKTSGEMNLDEKTQSYLYYKALVQCFEEKPMEYGISRDIIQRADAVNGHWFQGDGNNEVRYGYYNDGNMEKRAGGKDQVTCDTLVRLAAPLWGYTDPIGMLCAFWKDGNGSSGEACRQSQTNEGFNLGAIGTGTRQDAAEAFRNAIKQRVYGGQEPQITNAMKYLLYEAAFFAPEGCSAKPLTGDLRSGMNEDLIYENVDYVKWVENTTYKYFVASSGQEVVNPSPSLLANVPEGYFRIERTTTTEPKIHQDVDFYGIMNGDERTVAPDQAFDNSRTSCRNIASALGDYSDDYGSYLASHPSEWEALSGINNTGGAYCATNPEAPGCQPDNNSTSCAINGIGWIVCGVMKAVAGMNDLMYEGVENILLLNPLAMTQADGTSTPTYEMWKSFRDIANALLVIAFLIIIFSQLTSLGVSNYGIKKTLPRIIIVAIAINLSFFVMMVAVDLVNIIGVGLHDMISGLANDAWNSAEISGGWEDVIGGVLAGTITAGVIGGAIALSSASAVGMMVLPFVLGAVLAIFAAFVTLALRNALVIVLALIAPLAFAAFLLPNTKSLFDKWRKLLSSMLFMFPVAALLFSGAKLAGAILMSPKGSSNEVGTLDMVFGLFVAAAPLFMLPWLAKSSGGILGKVGSSLDKMGRSVQGRTQKALAPAIQRRKDERMGELKAAERNLFGRRIPERPRVESPAYKKAMDELRAGRREGESEMAWNSRRQGLLARTRELSAAGARYEPRKQTLAQRLALGQAARDANIARLKKQPGEQLKELAEMSGRTTADGRSGMEQAGYSRSAQKLGQRAAATINAEMLSDTRAKATDARIKQRFESGTANRNAILEAKAAETSLATEQARTNQIFEVRNRDGVIMENKAAEAGLKAAQDATGQRVQELSTAAGAAKAVAKNPELADVANELQVAHDESQIAKMATDSATRVATTEFATRMISKEDGGELARRAAGIDEERGEARAKAKAQSAVAAAYEETVTNFHNDLKQDPKKDARVLLDQLRGEEVKGMSEEQVAATIRRIGEIGGASAAVSLAELTPDLPSDRARDEAKGVIAKKLDKYPALASSMPLMSQGGTAGKYVKSPSGAIEWEGAFSLDKAWTDQILSDNFTLKNFMELQEQQGKLLEFAGSDRALASPYRDQMLTRLTRIKEQLDANPLARQEISDAAYDKLKADLDQLSGGSGATATS